MDFLVENALKHKGADFMQDGRRKISIENRQYIIKHTEINYKILAKKFGVCPTYIYEIRRRYELEWIS